MNEVLILLIVGFVFIVIGILNRKGNVKMMHSYHYNKVLPEDIIPFGKKVGLGMFFIGGSILLNSILCAIVYYTDVQVLVMIAKILLVIGFVLGISIIFYAMIKYNKGIF